MTKVVMANSFRGGTGKSTIISNIAYRLASLGKKVVIIDADILSPGVHAIFGFRSKSFSKTYTDYLLGNSGVIDSTYDISESVGLPDGRLFLAPASLTKANIMDLVRKGEDFTLLEKSVKKMEQVINPDFILIDTHPGLNQEFLVATGFTDTLLNIIRPDNQDYQGVEVTADVAKKVKVKTYLIINKISKKIDKKQLKSSVEEAFKLPIIGMLPYSETIMMSQSQFVFSERYPNHMFSREIEIIVEEVFGVRHRSHLELMRDVLLELKRGKESEEEVLARYRNELLKKEFIETAGTAVKTGKEKYKIPDKGEKFLKKYKDISSFVDKFRL